LSQIPLRPRKIVFLLPLILGLAVFAAVYAWSGRYEAVAVVDLEVQRLWRLRDSTDFREAAEWALAVDGKRRQGDLNRLITFVPLTNHRTAIYIAAPTAQDASRLAAFTMEQLDRFISPSVRRRFELRSRLQSMEESVPRFSAVVDREFANMQEVVGSVPAGSAPDRGALLKALETLRYWLDLIRNAERLKTDRFNAEWELRGFDAEYVRVAPSEPQFRRSADQAMTFGLLAGAAGLLVSVCVAAWSRRGRSEEQMAPSPG
jgi:hypothetical protein